MLDLVKKTIAAGLLTGIVLFASCNSKKDYSCTLAAGTVVTNPDGTQYTVTDTETQDCVQCTSSDVQKLKDQGYSCR